MRYILVAFAAILALLAGYDMGFETGLKEGRATCPASDKPAVISIHESGRMICMYDREPHHHLQREKI